MTSQHTAVTESTERPVRRRRGGTAVENAISDAVIAELAEVGFGRLSFEGVAERAGTGKSPLYRRWPDATSMVIDTLEKLVVGPAGYRRTGILRDDLIGLTVHMTKTLQGGGGRSPACGAKPIAPRRSSPGSSRRCSIRSMNRSPTCSAMRPRGVIYPP